MELMCAEPFPRGCHKDEEGIRVCAVFPEGKQCGILLYDASGALQTRVVLPARFKSGSVYSAFVRCDTSKIASYRLFCDSKVFSDPYAEKLGGLETWGVNTPDEELYCLFREESDVLADDVRPRISLTDSFLYLLHVRGFTMQKDSGVSKKNRGTFAGVIEKIPYLKDLGVTAIELMPAYEMNIVTVDESPTDGLFVDDGHVMKDASGRIKINYWGYKEGFYMAPRAAYASDPAHADQEFMTLVKALHENGMEVILQFYFPNWITPVHILDVIRFWVYTYHIDGVHLKGERIPATMIATDPVLQDIKILHDDFDVQAIRDGSNAPVQAQIAEYRNDFRITASRFLKGDDATLTYFVSQMNHIGTDLGAINYVGNYDGFTLMDLVSYEHKHNEENGENNRDGEDNNFSWNCGIEGKSRKKGILALRKKQIMNILTMLFLSQGTPMLHAGDEFGNSQNGNNNPYCQDNTTGWTDWSQRTKNEDILQYVKWLIALRRRYGILHTGKPFSLTDSKSIGYPDLSYHGIEAWRPDLSSYSHAVGFLYSGVYADEKAPFLFVAFNMHWGDIKLALPTLPKPLLWMRLSDTETGVYGDTAQKCPQEAVKSASRSVQILISSAAFEAPKHSKRQPF